MPQLRVKLDIDGVDSARLQTFRTNAEGQLVGRQVARRIHDWSDASDDERPHARVLDLTFQTRTDAEAFLQWFRDNLATIRALVRGRASFHICTNDDATVENCRLHASYREVLL